MKNLLKIFVFCCILISPIVFIACSNSNKPTTVDTKYVISFNIDEQEVSTLTTAGNETLNFPIPTKAGFEFKGWFLDNNFINLVTEDYFANKSLEEDITLYAKFITASYTQGLVFELQSNDSYAVKSYDGTSTEIVIPETYLNKKVSKVIKDAFKNNKNITSVTIGNNVKEIEEYAFYYCSNLSTINISNNISKIGNYAFKWTGVSSLNIPNTLQTIGEYAFEGCNSLTSMTFENNSTLEIISKYAFHGCQYLENITIPKSVKQIGINAFDNCKRLSSVTFEQDSGLENIENNVFQYCSDLSSITLPNGIKSIGDYSFSYCSLLETVVLPEGLISIGSSFYSCQKLQNINIPGSVSEINSYAFQFCSKLSSISIPASVTNIGINPFAGCTSLTSITVDADNSVFDSRNNCNAIIRKSNNQLVAGCKNTIIPNSVASIGQYAFQACGLSNILIPSEINTINKGAFIGCSTLTTVIMSETVELIDEYCFSGCTGLNSIYYLGTENEWESIQTGTNYLWQATPIIYYYSETNPVENGNFWHYDTDGITPKQW